MLKPGYSPRPCLGRLHTSLRETSRLGPNSARPLFASSERLRQDHAVGPTPRYTSCPVSFVRADLLVLRIFAPRPEPWHNPESHPRLQRCTCPPACIGPGSFLPRPSDRTSRWLCDSSHVPKNIRQISWGPCPLIRIGGGN